MAIKFLRWTIQLAAIAVHIELLNEFTDEISILSL